MYFANPTYLWALTGLIVPLAIHFWSNKKGRIIEVGNTQFLQQSEVPQSSSIHLNEYVLLLLRMLILAIIVLIMAEPHINAKKSNVEITYVVEESLIDNREFTNFLPDISSNFETRLLKKGLPLLGSNKIETSKRNDYETPNYWSFVPDLEKITTDSLVIITTGNINGLHGKRPETFKNAKWIIIDDKESQAQKIAIAQNDNTYEILASYIKDNNLLYKKNEISLNQIEFNEGKDMTRILADSSKTYIPFIQRAPYLISIISEDSLKEQATYFQAGFNSLSKYLKYPLTVTMKDIENVRDTTQVDMLVWLSAKKVMINSARVITLNTNQYSDELILIRDSNRYELTALLTPENITERNFSEALLSILGLNIPINQRLNNLDDRIVAETEIQPVLIEKINSKPNTASVDIMPWLFITLLLLFLFERVLSKRRSQ